MDILYYVISGIIVALLILAGALRWSVWAADRGGHQASNGHFRESGEGWDGHSSECGEGGDSSGGGGD